MSKMDGIWTTSGFEAFRRGKFGNGGQNIYVSRAGVLQRIHRFRAHDTVEPERFCGKFMQYRLILYSFNSVSTPRVRSVSVKFAPCDFR